MFDVINGLPVHALVVHAAVVLLPLMSLVTIAFTVRPRWRPGLPWAILGNLIAMGTAFAAAESGGQLQIRLSIQAGQEIASEHGDLGALLPNYSISLVVASVLAYLLVGRTGKRQSATGDYDDPQAQPKQASVLAVVLAVILVVTAGAVTTAWTYRVGDSGAKAVWEDTIANTRTP